MERGAKKISQLYYWGFSLAGHLIILALLGLLVTSDPQVAKPDVPMEVEMVDDSSHVLAPPPVIPEKELNSSLSTNFTEPSQIRSTPRLFPASAGGGNEKNSTPVTSSGDMLAGKGVDGVEGASDNPGTGKINSDGANNGSGSGVGPGNDSGKTGQGTTARSSVNWRDRFASLVEQNKNYPSAERKAGISGVTVIRVVIAPNGTLLESSVVSSSGNRALDNAAQRAVRGSVPFPHEYGGNLTTNLRIRFELN